MINLVFMKSSQHVRIASIDIMRGLTVFLMLFVNDLYVPGVPRWMVHAGASEDRIGLADVVFPGFLFLVGVSVPFAIAARRNSEVDTTGRSILLHIIIRSASLIVIGVMILNGSERLNATLTGMPKLVWLLLLYLGVFLLGNQYKTNDINRKFLGFNFHVWLKLLGGLLILFLLLKFKAGNEGNLSWLHHSWWGILGLIGWGYLAAALTYLLFERLVIWPILLCSFFLFLNIASLSGWISGLYKFKLFEFFEVWLSGNVPFITLSGLLIGMFLQRISNSHAKFIWLFFIGVLAMLSGFILRRWFIFSKIMGTPSWAFLCIGISSVLLSLLYFIVDVKRGTKWAYPFTLAGRNALSTYLAPDMIYFILWSMDSPIFFYKQTQSVTIAVIGSLVWSMVMVFYVQVLSLMRVRLKL